VTWYEAAQYCNWLTTSNAYTGAYQFNGSGTLTNVMSRTQILANGGLFYVLPTEDEWYKAAYFKTNASGYSLYANGTSTAPGIETEANYGGVGGVYSGTWAVGTGTMEQNGTYDMMGNLSEWNESAWDGTLNTMSENRVVRGGSYSSISVVSRSLSSPASEGDLIGFRVVAIPEPATAFSLALGGLIITGYRRLRKSYGHF
jgi:formylglycine-generating enzyme required for sulfatase activity